MSNSNSTRKVYFSVVEDVISNVREAFLDEGVDEQVLQELKQLWESKLTTSRALEPPDPEPVVGVGNIPYQLMQPQSSQNTVHATSIQQQIPVPVQLGADGNISSAASMAFSAQPQGMFQQQVQALVNVNPGAQLTLQQTANGQFILQALPPGMNPGVSQAQMVNIQPQTIVQAQPGQIQGQTLPQFDGTHDEDSVQCADSVEDCTNTCVPSEICMTDCSIVCNDENGQTQQVLEVQVSKSLDRKLRHDLKCHKKKLHLVQLDGVNDTSSSEDDDDDDDDDDNNDDDEDKEDGDEEGEEEEPLNSEDDVSEDDPTEVFDTDNVVVCQFEKISRNKGKWKFFLKDGIMNLEGKDHVFQRGTGEADW